MSAHEEEEEEEDEEQIHMNCVLRCGETTYRCENELRFFVLGEPLDVTKIVCELSAHERSFTAEDASMIKLVRQARIVDILFSDFAAIAGGQETARHLIERNAPWMFNFEHPPAAGIVFQGGIASVVLPGHETRGVGAFPNIGLQSRFFLGTRGSRGKRSKMITDPFVIRTEQINSDTPGVVSRAVESLRNLATTRDAMGNEGGGVIPASGYTPAFMQRMLNAGNTRVVERDRWGYRTVTGGHRCNCHNIEGPIITTSGSAATDFPAYPAEPEVTMAFNQERNGYVFFCKAGIFAREGRCRLEFPNRTQQPSSFFQIQNSGNQLLLKAHVAKPANEEGYGLVNLILVVELAGPVLYYYRIYFQR